MKHVLQGDRVPGMVVQRQPKDSEHAVPTIVDLWHDAVPTESLTGHGPLAEYVVPTQTTDNVEPMEPTAAQEGKSLVDPKPKPLSKRQSERQRAKDAKHTTAADAQVQHESNSSSESDSDEDIMHSTPQVIDEIIDTSTPQPERQDEWLGDDMMMQDVFLPQEIAR